MFILQVMSSQIQFKISCFQFSSLQELSIIPYSVPCSKRSNESKRDVDFFFFSFTLKLIPRFYHLVKTNLCRVSKKHIAAICCRATHRFTITKQNAALTPPSKKKQKKNTGKNWKKKAPTFSISPSHHWQPPDRKWKSQNFNKQNQLCLFRQSSRMVETLSREVLELNSPRDRSACWLLFVVLPAFCHQSAAPTHRGGRASHSTLEADGGSAARSRG